jgi:hypothetical protein
VNKVPLTGAAPVQISDVNANRVIGADATFVYVANVTCRNASLFKIIK